MKISYIRYAVMAVAMILGSLGAKAGDLTAHRGTVSNAYNFWLYTPDAPGQDVESKPVVIFLHGASLCGNNLNRVKRYGTIDAIEKGRDIDAYVIAPQNPGGSWNPGKIMNILDWVSDNYNIDYDRVYVLGMSLGGYGTIDLAATYPDRIAAAMAFCGGGTVKDLSGLNDVPLWIVHGTGDRAVSVNQSDNVVDKMRSSSEDGETPRLIYDRIPGMNHSQPARLFYLEESYEWLFAHTLKDHTREVKESFAIDSSTLKGAYRDLRSSRSGKSNRVQSAFSKTSSKKPASRKSRRRRS